jgi:hypothetical protein
MSKSSCRMLRGGEGQAFFKTVVIRKEPEPQSVISAPEGHLISAARLWLPNNGLKPSVHIDAFLENTISKFELQEDL